MLHLRRDILSLILTIMIGVSSLHATVNKEHNLTDEQLHAVMGIITNFILMSDSVLIPIPTLATNPGSTTEANSVTVDVQSTVGNSVYVDGVEVGVIGENGILSIVLVLNHGDNEIHITVKDASGNESQPLILNIHSNALPVGTADSITTNEDTLVTIDVLDNDTDVDDTTLNITNLTNPTNGTVNIVSNKIEYTPNANWSGTDTFTYTPNDSTVDGNVVTVTVTVSAVNDAPVGTSDSITTNEDTLVTIDVLGNDSDVDSSTLNITNLTNPTNGTVNIVSNKIEYTPNVNWSGTDTFTYTPNDSTVDGNVVTVTVTVSAVNDAPVGIDDNITTDEDTAVTIDVLSNDNDIENDALIITNLISPSNGTVSIVSNKVLYTPNTNWSGTDTFTYTPNDSTTDGNVVTVTVTVIPSNIVHTYSGANPYEVYLTNKPSDSFDYKLELGSNTKDVYLVFTNSDEDDAISAPSVVRENIPAPTSEIFDTNSAEISTTNEQDNNSENIIPAYVREYNKNPPMLIEKDNNLSINYNITVVNSTPDTVGDSKVFHINQTSDITATCKKVVNADNGKTLNIWVANDAFGTNCGKSRCMTQEMVDITAEKFLIDGANNDIYDYVTNIVGDEWGNESLYSSHIDDNNEITILFFDINNDDSINGGTLGYFWSKDNIKQASLSYSNERVMFYIDSVLFAKEDNGASWAIDNFWPSRLISTLAHEFQHMIHYYQKVAKQGVYSETWVNEMCAMLVQDLVGDKIGSNAPRGVDENDGTAGSTNNYDGRLPRFNGKNYIPLTTWGLNDDFDTRLDSYSISYSFGAFLIRNYGGAELLKEIVQNDKEDYAAVVDAVNSVNITAKTFSDLMREWGAAVLLSDKVSDDRSNGKYEYNIGDFFTSTVNGLQYNFGSINMFNYSTQPEIYIHTSDLAGDIGKYKTSNVYYKVGEDLTGDIELSISLDAKTEMTVIVK